MKILIPLFVLMTLSVFAQDEAQDELLSEPIPETTTPALTTTTPDDTGKELLTPPNPETTTPVITSTVEPDKIRVFNPRKGHLVTTFGFEALKYDVPFEFRGARKNFSPKQQDLFGARFGLGAEIYIGGGLNTTSKAEVYYVGTLFTKAKTADPDVQDLDFAYTKQTGQVYGVDAAQSLGFLFDMKTHSVLGNMVHMTCEPYIEIGAGVAKAYNRIVYHYDTGPSGVREDYRLRANDNLLSGRLAVGMNIISAQGYFLHLKLTQTRYQLTSRKLEGYEIPNPAGPKIETDKDDNDAKIDPTVTFILGGGYKF